MTSGRDRRGSTGRVRPLDRSALRPPRLPAPGQALGNPAGVPIGNHRQGLARLQAGATEAPFPQEARPAGARTPTARLPAPGEAPTAFTRVSPYVLNVGINFKCVRITLLTEGHSRSPGTRRHETRKESRRPAVASSLKDALLHLNLQRQEEAAEGSGPQPGVHSWS